MKTISVNDMHCENCVNRIGKALTELNISHNILLDDKCVTIDEDGLLDQVLEVLEDLGFEKVEVL